MNWRQHGWFIRFALIEKRVSFLIILTLTLGNIGLAGIHQIRNHLERRLAEQSKEMLGGDISISGRRALNENEQKLLAQILPKDTRESIVTEFYSMAAAGQVTRLAEIIAVDPAYPFYGTFRTGESIQTTLHSESPRIWVSSEFANSFQVAVGSNVKLGQVQFTVSRVLSPENSSVTRMMSLAPRVYIERYWASKTDLLKFGSTRTERRLLKLSDHIDLKNLRQEIQKKISDPGIRVVTASEASQQLARALTLLTPYLGLISVFGWILAGITVYYLSQIFVQRALPQLSTIRAIGMSAKAIYFEFLSIALVWALISGCCTLLFTTIFLPKLAIKMPDFAGIIPGESSFDLWTFGAPMVLVLLSTLEPILQITRSRIKGVKTLGSFLLVILLVTESRSYTLAALGFTLIMIGLWLAPQLFLSGIRRRSRRLSFGTQRIVLNRILFYSKESTLWIAVLGVSSILALTVLSVEHWIQDELFGSAKQNIPHSFLFDIQDEQLAPLHAWALSHHWAISNESPLIQARLVNLNGKSVSQISEDPKFVTQEEEQSQRLQNRTFNLSIRSRLSRSEKSLNTVVAKHPESIPCSVENRFARRLNLKLNDTMEFDVQGSKVSLEVTELRKVQWTSFEPNFFVWVRPGTVLDDAPKTWLASAQSDPDPVELQKSFPNIAVVDVKSITQRLSAFFDQLSIAIRLISSLVVILAILSLLVVAWERTQAEHTLNESMKLMGVPRSFRLRIPTLASRTLSVASIAGSLGISILLNQILSHLFFEGDWIFPGLLQIGAASFFLLFPEALIRLTLRKQ